MSDGPSNDAPPLALIGRVDALVATSKATGTVQIELQGATAGEWEYVLVTRVPSMDMQKGSTKPLAVLFPGVLAARWSTQKATVGDTVKLLVDTVGIDNAAACHFKIWDFDDTGKHKVVAELDGKVDKDKVSVSWKIAPPKLDASTKTAGDLAATGFDHPDLFFEVAIGDMKADSGSAEDQLLIVSDLIDRLITDEAGQPIPGASYIVTLSNGQERRGKLTAESHVVERGVPPGRFDIKVIRGVYARPDKLPEKNDALKKERAPIKTDLHSSVFRTPSVRVGGISFAPQMVTMGGKVKLGARVTGGADGDPVVFRVIPDGAKDPLVSLQGSLAGGAASVDWTVPNQGSEIAWFHIEVAYKDRTASTRDGGVRLVAVAPATSNK